MSGSPLSLKKQHERFILGQFFNAANLRGEIVDDRSEAPDFIVKFGNELVGIEMTELFVSDGSNAANLQTQESLAQRIVLNAQRLYVASGARPAHVSVHFAPRVDLRSVNRDEIAAALCALVKTQAPEVDQLVQWRQDYVGNVLPEAVTYVQMLGVPERRMAHWTVPNAGWVVPMTQTVLQASVDEKATLLPRYAQRVATNWLLLVSDGPRPSQLFDDPSAPVAFAISSPFARTFYFARMRGTVVELGVPET